MSRVSGVWGGLGGAQLMDGELYFAVKMRGDVRGSLSGTLATMGAAVPYAIVDTGTPAWTAASAASSTP